MNIGTHIKQPVEVKDYDIDYSEWMASGDEIESAVVQVSPSGLVLDVFTSPTRVKVWCSGGVDGTKYKVTATATTTDGRVKQDEFTIRVKDQ